MSLEFSLLITVIMICAVLGCLNGGVAYLILVERKISAWVQDRVGPNRAFYGLLQPICDGVKLLLKEEMIPKYVDKIFFMIAPAIALITAFMALAVVPFGPTSPSPILIDYRQNSPTFELAVWPSTKAEYDAVIDADRSRALEKKTVSFEDQVKVYNSRIQFVLAPHVDIGILFVFAIGSLGVYGVILGGWSSNNKYSLLGSLRSSAQLISYEIPLGLSVLGVVLVTGSLNLERIIQHQVDHGWNVLFQPLAMVLFATSIFAECNRLPFDLPESEQELVGGYHTEYSSMKFALFLFGEYTHMITTSFLMMTVFFGAWHLPFITDPNDFSIFGIALKFAVAAGKTIGFIIFYMLIRWTILRFRFDQLMHLAWKIMLPISLASFTVLVFIVHFKPLGQESIWLMCPVSLAILLASGFIGFKLSKPTVSSTKSKVPYLGHGTGYSVQHDSEIRFESSSR